MFEWVKGLFSKRGRSVKAERWERYHRTGRPQAIQAKYDIAQPDPTSRRYWANADHLSAVAANRLEVRRDVRSKARYETGNSCHARGISLTLANDLVGTGARLQVMHPDEEFCDAIETPWNAWADEICLGEKLHTFSLATVVDGESIMLRVINEQLYHSVKMDLEVKECDLLTTPDSVLQRLKMSVDGIEFDERGKPEWYHLLKVHPGDTNYFGEQDFDRIHASNVFHWFRMDRAGQQRGMSELTPALPIFSQLRRYTLAVLAAAEIAADFAMFISTDMPHDEVGPDDRPSFAFDISQIDHGMLTQLPANTKPWQLTPAQPTTGHNEFTKGLLREACHALLIPYNLGNADFEGDSYAGGRLSLQVYQRYLGVRRMHLRQRVLNRIFAAWLQEAKNVKDLLPESVPWQAQEIPYTWFFDGWGHVDPTKEAEAIGKSLLDATTTLQEECALQGKDWRKVIRQRGIEVAMLMEAGALILPPGTIPPGQTDADLQPQGAAA